MIITRLPPALARPWSPPAGRPRPRLPDQARRLLQLTPARACGYRVRHAHQPDCRRPAHPRSGPWARPCSDAGLARLDWRRSRDILATSSRRPDDSLSGRRRPCSVCKVGGIAVASMIRRWVVAGPSWSTNPTWGPYARAVSPPRRRPARPAASPAVARAATPRRRSGRRGPASRLTVTPIRQSELTGSARRDPRAPLLCSDVTRQRASSRKNQSCPGRRLEPRGGPAGPVLVCRSGPV